MTSWASAFEHVTSGFAMEKSTTICETKLCKNARIPALGYGAFSILLHLLQPHSLAQVSEHFCTIFSRKLLLISPLQSRMSHARMQRPMTSFSPDPMRAFFIHAHRQCGPCSLDGGTALVFPRLISHF